MYCLNPENNQYFYQNPNGPLQSSTTFTINQPPVPEVVGEGEVKSVVLPDGNVQFYFLPTTVQWRHDPNFGYNRTQCYPQRQPGAWHIKSFSYPVQGPQAQFFQPQPNTNVWEQSMVPASTPMQFETSAPEPGTFPLKFHNDGWTSTTDIHYFFPNLRYPEYMKASWAQFDQTRFWSNCQDTVVTPAGQNASPMMVEETSNGMITNPSYARPVTSEKCIVTYTDEVISAIICESGTQTEKKTFVDAYAEDNFFCSCPDAVT